MKIFSHHAAHERVEVWFRCPICHDGIHRLAFLIISVIELAVSKKPTIMFNVKGDNNRIL